MNKVCILTSVHSPFDIRIFYKEAMSLAKAGYEVTIIAQHNKDEIVDGVRIVPLPKATNRFYRMTGIVWLAYKKALEINATIYHFHDPELILIGILLCLQGKHVIYDIHENVPKDIKSKFWIHVSLRKIISKAASFLELFASKMLSGLISATPSIASRFPLHKTIVVQNFPILKELNANKVNPYPKRSGHIVYIGNITEIRGPKEMVKTMALLPDSHDIRLVIAGAFSSGPLEEEVRKLPGWARVDFLGWIEHEKTRALLNNSKIGLVLFHSAPNHIDSQPIKFFEYMAAGIPVIASDFPLWRLILEGSKCGLLVDPLDPNTVAEAIQWLLEHPKEAEIMGENGRNAVKNKYNWEKEEEKLLAFYDRLLYNK